MNIGITGPVALAPFLHLLPSKGAPPNTYSFPLIGELVRALWERGHNVTVFAGSTEIDQTWTTGAERIDLIVVPLRKKRAAYDFYRAERVELASAMSESRCDIIHAHWTYEFAAAALDSGRPSLVTAHDSPFAILRYFICTRYFPFWIAKALLGASVIRRGKYLTTVSPYCRDAIQRAFYPSAPISVIPNGIDNTLIEIGNRRLARSLPSGPFTVATVLEGFQHRKNPKNAIKAFALFRRRHPSARLVMFGTGYESGGAAEDWAQERQLSEGLEFAGKVGHDVLFKRLETEFHTILHPAREESFGMSPLEAMSLGIPVIGGLSSGGVPYVLDDGRAGLLVDVERPAEIAAALEKLAEDPNLSFQLAAAGHQRASSTFPISKMVDAYETEYRKILGHQ